jgi:GH25 family lysozyme M1 (1,4-beta-N-acetylmuramidase)
MNPIGYGLDVSQHNPPAALPWESFRGHVDFVIARAAYGGRMLDKHAVEHVKRARDIGAKVGAYLFFRPSQSVAEQWDALRLMVDRMGLGVGDIVPAIDIELDPIPYEQPVVPAWSDACEKLVGKVTVQFGDCLVYITQREFGFLGRPQWVLDRPLWCAHYVNGAPATPGGKTPVIHQHRVDDFAPNGLGGYDKTANLPLDQNRLFLPLPLIGAAPQAVDEELRARVDGLVAMTIDEEIRNSEPSRLA